MSIRDALRSTIVAIWASSGIAVLMYPGSWFVIRRHLRSLEDLRAAMSRIPFASLYAIIVWAFPRSLFVFLVTTGIGLLSVKYLL